MPESEKHIKAEVHDDSPYTQDQLEDKKEAALSSPPSGSDITPELDTSAINEKALLRKLDRKLLPAVTLLYLLSFLDRSNGKPVLAKKPLLGIAHLFLVANARIEGLVVDLHMSRMPMP